MIYNVDTDIALLLLRVSLGLFLAISGYHKLFNAKRHYEFVGTLMMNHVYNRFTEWAVPTVEFFGGLGLIFGLLTQLASAGLLVILGTAIFTDCMGRIAQLNPIDSADAVCDFLYLPEVMYAIMLVAILFAGPGQISLDAAIDKLLVS